jgi:hypothetical protein
MKHTTRRQDAAFILHLYAEATKQRQIGDRVLAKGGGETTITAIEGESATLANGESWHISKLRSAPEIKDTAAKRIKLSDVHIYTNMYELSHGHKPRGRGSWAFHFGDDVNTPWWTPGSLLYSEATKLVRIEAQRRGVTAVAVGT